MFSLFKKKPLPSQSLTLKARVEEFWKWYTEVAPRFYATIEAKKCPDLAPEVTTKVNELFSPMMWVFGPGPNRLGHSFTLTGEGVIHRQMVALYWLSRAPTLPGWTFYASRQPGPIKGHTIKINDRVFDPMEFWITPTVDIEKEKVNIVVWHPLFEILEKRDQHQILFLFLDELLGEYGTDQNIGVIELENKRLADAIPLGELLDFVEATKASQGWKKYPPGESFTGYSCKEPHDRFIRGDVIAGTTSNWRLVRDYLDADGELEDPLKDTGADFIFVSFDALILPEGKQSHARGEIEEALDEALKAEFSGQVLGGAHGTRNAYIDIMIFDGSNSLEIIKRVLRDKKLPSGTEIHFFAKEKCGYRIVL